MLENVLTVSDVSVSGNVKMSHIDSSVMALISLFQLFQCSLQGETHGQNRCLTLGVSPILR